MIETHSYYIITSSTYPGKDSGIEALIQAGAKLIFVHSIIYDNKDRKLIKQLDEISSRGSIPGIATHDPVNTINYCRQYNVNVKAFLVPFNEKGTFMEQSKDLECLIDRTKNYAFVGMKTLAVGCLDPKYAYNYIAKHNICSVAIGMVSVREAEETTKIALEALRKKIK